LYQDDAPMSNQDRARVRVMNDPIFDDGLLIGRVFCDQNGDGKPDAGDEGVLGARVYIDTGWYAVTDETGKYHLKDIVPGVHLIKVDAATLPAGAALSGDDSQIIWFTRGLPAKANFAVRCADVELGPDQVIEKQAAAPKPKPKSVRVAGDLDAWTLFVDGAPVPLYEVTADGDPPALAPPSPPTLPTGMRGPHPVSWSLPFSAFAPA